MTVPGRAGLKTDMTVTDIRDPRIGRATVSAALRALAAVPAVITAVG
jgi:hypothetical protein